MSTGDSHKQLIPPTQVSVKAGFVVYSPDDETRNIIILNKGELAAVDRSEIPAKTIFKMQPGELVGVAALLEREPFKYTLDATQDSEITLISEDCMESELKTLPLWLLAVIKGLSAQTRKLKEATRKPRVQNTLKSLSEYISHLEPKKSYPMDELCREFRWQTKIPESQIQADLKALARRQFLEIRKGEKGTEICSDHPMLLQIYVDYQKASEKNKPWAPFQLTDTQKKALTLLAALQKDVQTDAPSWLKFFTDSGIAINVTEWIKMISFGWFKVCDDSSFQVNKDKILYYQLALRYAANIRGVL